MQVGLSYGDVFGDLGMNFYFQMYYLYLEGESCFSFIKGSKGDVRISYSFILNDKYFSAYSKLKLDIENKYYDLLDTYELNGYVYDSVYYFSYETDKMALYINKDYGLINIINENGADSLMIYRK